MTDSARGPLPPLDPLAFSQTFGLLHRPVTDRAALGVVIVEPSGYDALSLRRPLRLLADRLAGLGVPVLRYDQPGAGDSLEEALEVGSLDRLADVLDAACERLVAETGVARVVPVGLGLGAVLAARWASARPERVAGLVLLAPMASGRAALREWQMRAAMIGELTGALPVPRDGAALVVAGLPVADALAGELRKLKVSADDCPADLPVLALARPGVAAEEALAGALGARAGGEAGVFDGHDEAVADPTLSAPPEAVFARVCDFVTRIAARPETGQAGDAPKTGKATLVGQGFRERLMVFGPGQVLVGVWCEPVSAVAASAEGHASRPVIFVGAGGNPRAGWARGTADMARGLARESGISSLRFDLADVGDSRPRAGGAAVVHYSDGQGVELSAALDLAGRLSGQSRAVVAGVCGGAYLAVNGAVADARVAHVVAVNLQRFRWDPRDDVGEILRLGNVATRDYGRKLLDRGKLRRLMSGKVAVSPILRELARRALRTGERRLAPWLFGLSPFSRLYRQVHEGLAVLKARRVPVDLVFSEGDPGLAQLDLFFGRGHAGLGAYPNVSLHLVEGADHNFTRRDHRDHVAALLRAAARGAMPRSRAEAAE